MNRSIRIAAGIAGAAVLVGRRRSTDFSGEAGQAGAPVVNFADLEPEYLTVRTDDGTDLRVGEVGPESGPLVVLAHCWMGDQQYWGAVAAELVEDGFRVVAYDHRGHGSSTTGADRITIDRLASDLVAVLDRVATPGVILVGHSMGGMAIQAAAIGHPRIIKDLGGIVLVATSARPSPVRLPAAVAHRVLGESASVRIAGRPAARVSRAFGPRATAEQFKAVHDAIAATPGATRADCIVEISQMDLRSGLGRVTVPTKVIVGSHDRMTPPAKSRQLTELIPGARMTFLTDIGHMVPLEAPEAIIAAVRSLIRTTTTTGSPR